MFIGLYIFQLVQDFPSRMRVLLVGCFGQDRSALILSYPLVVGLVDMTQGLWFSFADHLTNPKSSNVFGCLLQGIVIVHYPNDFTTKSRGVQFHSVS